MQAIVFDHYGPSDVLRCTEVGQPAPGDDEVLIEVRASSVNPADWHFMRGTPYLVRLVAGLRKPKRPRLGIDVAGVVQAVGRKITQFRVGDAVFGACSGAFAQYVCVAEKAVVSKPASVSFEQAATIAVAASTALQGLRKGKIEPGQHVLVNGAAGGVGTFAVQIAKSSGAEVTGVCSTRNVAMVRAIGAHHVIDYTQQDFTRTGKRYDVLFDTMGNHPLSDCRRVLTPKGVLVMIGGVPEGNWIAPLVPLLKAMAMSPFVSQRLAPHLAMPSRDDLIILRGLLEAGKLVPVIDRTYALSQVPEAIRYLEEGHARGKVVITVDRADRARAEPNRAFA